MTPDFNIYFLHRDARMCAMWLYDAHLVRHLRDTGIMLSTACQRIGTQRDTVLYRPEYLSHDVTTWLCTSVEHFAWAVSLWEAMVKQYEELFRKDHNSWQMKLKLKEYLPLFPRGEWADPPKLVPDDCKSLDIVEAYRAYYLRCKVHGRSYVKVRRPFWVDDYLYGNKFSAADADLAYAIERAEGLAST